MIYGLEVVYNENLESLHKQSYIYIKGSLWWSYCGRISLDIVGKIPSNSKVICSLWIQKWFVKRYRNLTWRRLQYLLPLAVCQTLYPTMLAAQTRKTSLQSLPVLLLLWNCKTEEMKRKITDYQLWRIAGDNFCLQPMFVRDPYPCQDTDVLQMDDDFLYVFPFPMFVIFFVLGTWLEAMACGITTLRRSTKWQQSRCDDFQCHNGKLWQTAPWIQSLYPAKLFLRCVSMDVVAKS